MKIYGPVFDRRDWRISMNKEIKGVLNGESTLESLQNQEELVGCGMWKECLRKDKPIK